METLLSTTTGQIKMSCRLLIIISFVIASGWTWPATPKLWPIHDIMNTALQDQVRDMQSSLDQYSHKNRGVGHLSFHFQGKECHIRYSPKKTVQAFTETLSFFTTDNPNHPTQIIIERYGATLPRFSIKDFISGNVSFNMLPAEKLMVIIIKDGPTGKNTTLTQYPDGRPIKSIIAITGGETIYFKEGPTSTGRILTYAMNSAIQLKIVVDGPQQVSYLINNEALSLSDFNQIFLALVIKQINIHLY